MALVVDAAPATQRIISTQLFPIETNNTVRQRMGRGGISIDVERRLLAEVLAFGVAI